MVNHHRPAAGVRVWWLLTSAALMLAIPCLAAAQTIAGGNAHTLVVKPDGTVWAFGANSSGQLGTGGGASSTPSQVSGLTDVVAVAAGTYHSLALTSTGSLYVWGHNYYGQVGDGSTTNRPTPVQSSLSGVVAIAAGDYHSAALTSTGDVYTWGRNTNGQLATGNTTQANAPTLVFTAAAIAAGASHSIFVKGDGTVWAAGLNSSGQLGDASTTQRTSPVQMASISTATAAVAGGTHSVVLLADGTLRATGNYVGDGTSSQRTSPVTVSGLSSVTGLAAGASHTLARKSDGTLWAWGYNGSGQLGTGTTTTATAPVQVTTLASVGPIGAGDNHSLAATSDGIVYAWGVNSSSQLGDGTTEVRTVPTAISGPGYDWMVATPTLSRASGTYNIDQTVTIAVSTPGATIHYTQNGAEPTESDPTIASGSSLTINVSQTLKAKAWKALMPASNVAARAYTLQVALPTVTPSGGTFGTAQTATMTTATPGATLHYTTDGSVPTPSSTAFTAPITVGTTTTLKVLGFKTDWTTSNLRTTTITMNFGTLSAPAASVGTGSYVDTVTVTLTAMPGATIRYTTNNTVPQSNSAEYTGPLTFDVTTILHAKAFHPDYTSSPHVGWTYTMAAAAPVFSPTAGTYAAGQLVAVTAPSVGSTVRYTINGAEPTTSDPIIASGATLVVGNFTLKAKAWKTGAEASAVASATYTLTGPSTPRRIAAGDDHTLALRHDGVAWGWGSNSSGSVGDGTTVSPKYWAHTVAGLTGVVGIAAGNGHSFAWRADGTLYGWGQNSNGRLGDGTTTGRILPVLITLPAPVVDLDAGYDHTVGLTNDGTAWAWGTNGDGQVGDGTTTSRSLPTSVGLADVSAVAAGYRFSLALTQSGSVWAWGMNSSGQLGDGSTTSRLSPVSVTGLSSVVAVAAGQQHGLAVLQDGSVRAWGSNYGGFLGDGTTVNQTSPVTVLGLSNVTDVSAGSTFSLALDAAGHVWAWGTNGAGQLGDGTTTGRALPAQIDGLEDIVAISTASASAFALSADGTVWAWGLNSWGKLGTGTTDSQPVPVAVSGPGMNWKVAIPSISLANGLYLASQLAVVAVADPEATLRYTTNGLEPTASDPTVASGGAIPIDSSLTLKVNAWRPGAPTSATTTRSYELKTVTPTFTPNGGGYAGVQTVSIASATPGVTIRYTRDGSEPQPTSDAYSAPLTVAETRTVKARAYRSGWTPSASSHASFWILAGTVATPTITPVGGSQVEFVVVEMSSVTSDATVRYTLDGSTPSAASPVFVRPLLLRVTTTVKARAFRAGFAPSTTASVTYDFDPAGTTAMPSIVPIGGTYATAQTVTITGPSGATLRYTTDGTDPTTAANAITSGETITVGQSQVIKVRAWQTGHEPSAVRRADFVISGALAGGGSHSVALKADGSVWAFGANTLGQLGDGSFVTRSVPVPVTTGAVAIAAGNVHTLAVKTDGTVWSWGHTHGGRLGRTGAGQTPAVVPGLSAAVSVAAGWDHSLVLMGDGTVWAFGGNAEGQLGDGTTTTRTSPVQIAGLSGIVAIAAGALSSYALQTDGAGEGWVWAWGRNNFGQLGDGSTLNRWSPIRVTGLSRIRQIAAGATHALALDETRHVFAWGRGASGQLGSGDTTFAPVPQPIPSLNSIWEIAASGNFGLAADQSGRLWGWGSNAGQLGNGQQGTALFPEFSNLREQWSLAAGDSHTLAIMPSGNVMAFGQNDGRLGNGEAVVSTTPTTVNGLVLADGTWLSGDADRDSLPTWREYLLGTDPLNRDTNGNGIIDSVDASSGMSPVDHDLDGDGVSNWAERTNGTDPMRPDSDRDGVNDGIDAFPLDPMRWQASTPTPGDTTPPVITLTQPTTARPVP